ncbi:hypothetical protein BT69DRAFT_690653 [Atractiella rhizophila]|nr:hypothetical protein BT69DRAFT_690653 [Atractiella rhizophila]
MSSFLSRKPHARISSVTLNPYSPTASPNPQATSFTQSNSSFDSYAAHPAKTTYSSSGTTLSLTTTVSHHGSYFLAGLLQFMSLFSDRTVDLLATDRKVRENCLRTAVLQGVVLVAVLVGKAFGLGSLYTVRLFPFPFFLFWSARH